MVKKEEEMSIEELNKLVSLNEKRNGFVAKPFNYSEDGKIVLDPNNKADREWLDEDEDFGYDD